MKPDKNGVYWLNVKIPILKDCGELPYLKQLTSNMNREQDRMITQIYFAVREMNLNENPGKPFASKSSMLRYLLGLISEAIEEQISEKSEK